MSCDCYGADNGDCFQQQGPCGTPSNSFEESIASQLANLELNLFGAFTKTIVNGRAVWTALCNTSGSIPAVPRAGTEGFICYITRLMSLIGFFWAGTWDAGTQYYPNQVVLYGVNNDTLYVCIQTPPVGTVPTNASYFSLFIHAPASTVPGPQGPAGSPGSSATPNYATVTATTNYTASNNDAVIFAESSGSPFNITLPLMSTLTAGKWYIIRTDGAQVVTVLPTGTDTIQGGASYTLSLQNESIEIISKNTGNWFII